MRQEAGGLAVHLPRVVAPCCLCHHSLQETRAKHTAMPAEQQQHSKAGLLARTCPASLQPVIIAHTLSRVMTPLPLLALPPARCWPLPPLALLLPALTLVLLGPPPAWPSAA